MFATIGLYDDSQFSLGAVLSMKNQPKPTLWLPPLVLTLVMWMTVGYVRPITEWLRARGILANSIWTIFALIAAVVIWTSWKKGQPSGTGGGNDTLRCIFLLATSVATYIALMLVMVVAPEERFHFILVGLVTYLYFRLFEALWPTTWFVPFFGFLAGALVGGIEEGLQKFYPSRFFDWRDVGINVLAAFMATLLIHSLKARRRR